MRKLLFSCALLLSHTATIAQMLTGIAAKWNDSFREWIIYTEEEGMEGELRMRWQLDNDWSEWDYRLGEATGAIKIKWRGNPNEWELRGGNQIISMRTRWLNDSREWRIDATQQFIIKSRYGNIRDEWTIEESSHGAFEVLTAWEGDPREWVIADDLSPAVSIHTKIALVFAVLFNSIPKR